MDDTCPFCGQAPFATCPCRKRDSICDKQHAWHYCLPHQSLVLAPADHSSVACSCWRGDRRSAHPGARARLTAIFMTLLSTASLGLGSERGVLVKEEDLPSEGIPRPWIERTLAATGATAAADVTDLSDPFGVLKQS